MKYDASQVVRLFFNTRHTVFPRHKAISEEHRALESHDQRAYQLISVSATNSYFIEYLLRSRVELENRQDILSRQVLEYSVGDLGYFGTDKVLALTDLAFEHLICCESVEMKSEQLRLHPLKFSTVAADVDAWDHRCTVDSVAEALTIFMQHESRRYGLDCALIRTVREVVKDWLGEPLDIE